MILEKENNELHVQLIDKEKLISQFELREKKINLEKNELI